tara:strand:- start:510 stop:785 length:276 start_codon:yes stop_codon:yes gene_type:complete
LESKTPVQVERYRGFVLIPENDLSWQVRPERSPMHVLPFRTPACSIADVKALVDWRLARLGREFSPKADSLPKSQDKAWQLAPASEQQKAA